MLSFVSLVSGECFTKFGIDVACVHKLEDKIAHQLYVAKK